MTLVVSAVMCAGLPCITTEGSAQDLPDYPDVRRITLDEAVDWAEASNPQLRIARENVAAARGRLTSASAYPNPWIAANREQLGRDAALYYETTLNLTHTFEIGGQRGLRRSAAATLVGAAEARTSAERVRLFFAVRHAYLRAASTEERSRVLEEVTAIFRAAERAGQVRLVEGDISNYDQQRLKAERARYENLHADASLQVRRFGRELALLMAPDSLSNPDFLLLPVGTRGVDLLPATVPALDEVMRAAPGRPDVRAAALEVDAVRARLGSERRERVPDVTVSGGFKDQADGFRGAVVGVSFPLPLFSRNGGRVAEAAAELAAAEAQRALALGRARADIRNAWEAYRSLADRAGSIGGELLTGSETLLETARIAYAEGEMSLLELLDAAEAYLSAREISIDLVARALIAFYDLQRATGHPDLNPVPVSNGGASP